MLILSSTIKEIPVVVNWSDTGYSIWTCGIHLIAFLIFRPQRHQLDEFSIFVWYLSNLISDFLGD